MAVMTRQNQGKSWTEIISISIHNKRSINTSGFNSLYSISLFVDSCINIIQCIIINLRKLHGVLFYYIYERNCQRFNSSFLLINCKENFLAMSCTGRGIIARIPVREEEAAIYIEVHPWKEIRSTWYTSMLETINYYQVEQILFHGCTVNFKSRNN